MLPLFALLHPPRHAMTLSILHPDDPRFTQAHFEARVAALTALAVIIHAVEAMLPGAGPLFKPGLANIVGLAALWLLGFRAALLVTVLRILIGSLILGTFMSPTFLLSASGGLAAMLAMGLMHRFGGRQGIFGPVGVSIVGAIAYICAQFPVAYLVLIQHMGLFYLLPLLLATSLATGVLNGVIAHFMLTRLNLVSPPREAR